MIELEVTVDIDRPINEVFAYSTNNENDPAWMTEVTAFEKTSEGPVGVGSRFINHVTFLGRTFDEWMGRNGEIGTAYRIPGETDHASQPRSPSTSKRRMRHMRQGG